MLVKRPFSCGLVRGCVCWYIDDRVAVTRIWMTGGRGGSLLLFCALLLASGIAGQTPAAPTTTAAPSTTPVAGTPLTLSFMIDGIVYVLRCNITGLNMSNCTYDLDHGLTVSKIDSAGTTANIPDYVLAMIIGTAVLVLAILIVSLVGFFMKKPEAAGYGPVPAPPQGPEFYPQPAQYVPRDYGQAAQAGSRKVISVGLVKPCLPGDTGMP